MDNNGQHPRHAAIDQAVERINDLLAESRSSEQVIPQALGVIQTVMQRPGSALYLLDASRPNPPTWLYNQLPNGWLDHIHDELHPIHRLIQQALQTEQPVGGEVKSGIAGVFPLRYHDSTVGGLVIFGPRLSDEEIQPWQPLLAAFARLVYARYGGAGIFQREKLNSALRIMTEGQRLGGDINKIQFQMTKRIGELFEAEEVFLILVDEENPDLVIQKRLSNREDWGEQVSQQLKPGLVYHCIREQKTIEIASPVTYLDEYADLGWSTGLEVECLICVPLRLDQRAIGALLLVNVPESLRDDDGRALMENVATVLANTIYSARLFLELKISNADLEASRWELLNSRNTLRALFDSIPASMYIVDQTYNLAAINAARANRAQNQPNRMVGKKCYEVLYQRSSPCTVCRVADTLLSGRVTNRIGREWTDNDHYTEWDISTYPITDENGKAIQAIVTEQDITEKRTLEANLVQSEKLAAVGQLAAGVAHEINNPLAAIIANAQILRRQFRDENEDVAEALKLIESAGIRASQVVRNLLGIARKDKYEFLPIDLNETIVNALSLVQHEIVERNINVHTDLDPGIPLITASKDHLQGVWINLILNAIDALEDEKGKVWISTRYLGNEFRVTVVDNGRGIPPDKVHKVFEPFYTTKVPGRGTGLGLSVSLRTIKQHGGTISVESHVGQGTKFTVVLPKNTPVE